MKAVNLIPGAERRGATAISRAGGGAYLVLGTLAALVLMLAVYAIEGNRIDNKQAQAAQANQEAAAIEAQAAELSQYSTFAQLRDKRFETVSSIANSRFDWSNTLHDLARVIPPNTWLTTLRGTVSPGVNVEGGGGGSGVRAAIQAPAIEISGCTTSHPAVARMMARMRLMDGVTRVTLTSSEKADTAPAAGGAGDSSADSSDCRAGSDQYPRFEIVVFFRPPAPATQTPAATAAATTTTPTPGASQ